MSAPVLAVERLRAALLYLAVTIETVVVLVDKSDLVNPWEGQIFRVTFVLTFAAVALGSYTWREWGAIALGAALGLISWRVTGRNEILRLVMLVAACKGRSRERLLGMAFWETLAGCAGIFLLSAAGIFGIRAVETVARDGEGTALRWCFGFGHPNALHCMFYMLVLTGILLWGKRMRVWHWCLLLAADLGLFFLTGSRTGFAVAAATIVAGAILSAGGGALAKRPGLYRAAAAILLACVGFSVWAAHASIAIGYRYPEWRLRTSVALFLDRVLNSRISELYWASERADLASWRLFSHPGAGRYFDMGWCRLFYWYGIVPGILAVLLLLALIRYCGRKEEGMALLMLVSMAVYTVSEAHLVSVYLGRNHLLLLMGLWWCAMLGLDRGKETGLPAALGRISGGGIAG